MLRTECQTAPEPVGGLWPAETKALEHVPGRRLSHATSFLAYWSGVSPAKLFGSGKVYPFSDGGRSERTRALSLLTACRARVQTGILGGTISLSTSTHTLRFSVGCARRMARLPPLIFSFAMFLPQLCIGSTET